MNLLSKISDISDLLIYDESNLNIIFIKNSIIKYFLSNYDK